MVCWCPQGQGGLCCSTRQIEDGNYAVLERDCLINISNKPHLGGAA